MTVWQLSDIYIHNTNIMIEYQLPSGIMKYSKRLSYPLPIYVTLKGNPFLIQGSPPIIIKWMDFKLMVKCLWRGLFLYCKISFTYILDLGSYMTWEIIGSNSIFFGGTFLIKFQNNKTFRIQTFLWSWCAKDY